MSNDDWRTTPQGRKVPDSVLRAVAKAWDNCPAWRNSATDYTMSAVAANRDSVLAAIDAWEEYRGDRGELLRPCINCEAMT